MSLFQVLQNSSFYDILQKFELSDLCTTSYAANLNYGDFKYMIAILVRRDINDTSVFFRTLQSHLLKYYVDVVQNCTNKPFYTIL